MLNSTALVLQVRSTLWYKAEGHYTTGQSFFQISLSYYNQVQFSRLLVLSPTNVFSSCKKYFHCNLDLDKLDKSHTVMFLERTFTKMI